MSTTTVRIDDELKERIGAAAKRAGQTPHAFIVEAVAARVAEDEEAAELEHLADERWARFQADGRSVGLDQASAYLTERARGGKPPKPKARKL